MKKRGFRAGCVSDGSFLRRRTQLFSSYLYKPEAQAKVFQMPVLHSPIIPSLALQACKARKVAGESRFSHPPLNEKRVPELAEGALKETVADASGSERKLWVRASSEATLRQAQGPFSASFPCNSVLIRGENVFFFCLFSLFYPC